MDIRKAFICSKYRGDIENNLELAKKYCKFAMEKGYIPICPHLYFPQFLDDRNDAERCQGMKYGLSLMDFCDDIWIFLDENGKLSEGMLTEVMCAVKDQFGINIHVFDSEMKEITDETLCELVNSVEKCS